MKFTSPLAVAALLSSVALVKATCPHDATCNALGCKDDKQVVFGVTEIKEPRTTPPPYELAGFPSAVPVGAQDVGGGITLVTWSASEPTTTVIPKSTPALYGTPGTTYFITTSTFEYNGVKYEKPYVTSTTSTSYTKTETSTTTETQWNTVTKTETVTQFIPPPPCQNRQFKGWTDVLVSRDAYRVIQPFVINVNTETPSWLTLVDLEFKSEKYLVKLDGQPLGQTGDFVKDNKYTLNPDDAINLGFSWGKLPLPAGPHTVSVTVVDPGNDVAFKAKYKLDERCC